MAFTVPTTIGITGLAKNISLSTSVSEEIVTQVEVTIATGSTDEEIFLGILDISAVKAFTITTDAPVTYNFSAGAGQNFDLKTMVVLPGKAAEAFQEFVELTGGTLVVGQQYFISTYNATDDFTNVGCPTNAVDVSFIATGTTPTDWSNASTLVTKSKQLLSLFVTNSGTASANIKIAIVTSN